MDYISAFLEDQIDIGEPYQLAVNADLIFEGYKPLGEGFFITERERSSLLQIDPKNRDVLLKIINGKELNDTPTQTPTHTIIFFRHWSLEEARQYSAPFAIVEEKVKPLRAKQNRASNRDNWWRYGEHRPGLTKKLEKLSRCFVAARTTKYLSFSKLPSDILFSEALKVLTTDRWDYFSVVQSTLHEAWARKYSGSLKQDLRYSPRDCFETFPFPADSSGLATIGETYHEHRRQLMLKMQLGLTKTYNLFHTPNLSPETVEKASKQGPEVAAEAYDDILKLRDLHRQMDESVLAAYGWHKAAEKWGPAIDLRHDFYEVDYLPENDRTRYTIHPDARKEILKRLLLLNHERYAEEVKQGLHDKKTKKKRIPKATSVAAQNDLFGDEVSVPPQPAVAASLAQNGLENLSDGEWARPGTDQAAEEAAVLAAVLKAMGEPTPAREVRLAVLLAIEPRLLTPSLTAEEAWHWQRLIGPEAEPLATGVTQLQPPANHTWGTALRELRGKGRLVVDEMKQTWGPGAGLDVYATEGLWPEGRVLMVLDFLRRRGAKGIVQTLPDAIRDWVDARAA